MMLKLTVFSQKSIVDTIPVKSFPIPVVKAIIQDLIRGDSAIAELNLIKQEIRLYEFKNNEKDNIIEGLKKNEIKSQEIIQSERARYNELNEINKQLKSDLKLLNTTNKVLSIGGIGLLGIFFGVLITR